MQLRPDPAVRCIYEYCLAEAAERYGVILHAFTAMSNHHHVLGRDVRGTMPSFLGHFHKMLARAINALRGRWENLWAIEQPSAVYLVQSHDRFAKLVYVLANPVNDYLVEKVADWPGSSSLLLSLDEGTKVLRRPHGFFTDASKMPDEVALRIERPQGFEDLTGAQWRTKLEDAIWLEEDRIRRERSVSGRCIVGRTGVLQATPTDTPGTTAPRRELRPHIACAAETRRKEELSALLLFRTKRRAALERTRAGDRDVVFPYGTVTIQGVVKTESPPSRRELSRGRGGAWSRA